MKRAFAMKCVVTAVVVSCFLTAGGFAANIAVPSSYATIQAAIDAAGNGDTVIVAVGTYTGAGNRNIDFKGKAITVRGVNPNDPCTTAATIIDCQNAARGFYFHSGEGENSVLTGLTIANGYILDGGGGGGIFCSGSSQKIANCIIRNNQARGSNADGYYTPDGSDAMGGGICCASGSNPEITGCTIKDNSAVGGASAILFAQKPHGGQGFGGGVYCSNDSAPTVTSCRIKGNSATGGAGSYGGLGGYTGDGGCAYGGGIYVFSLTDALITYCDVTGNKALGGVGGPSAWRGDGTGGYVFGAGIYVESGAAATITNTVVSHNLALGGVGGTVSDTGPGGRGGDALGGGLYSSTAILRV